MACPVRTQEIEMDQRQYSAACERNRGPILEVLREEVLDGARVLEVASGTGMHAVWFSRSLPVAAWQPTDPMAESLLSIDAWRESDGDERMLPSSLLDVHSAEWPEGDWDVVYVANMIHIAPASATPALLRGASRVLTSEGRLILYGPYRQGGRMATGNEAFDEDLRRRNPEWGVRDLEWVQEEAARVGLLLKRTVAMPANNLTVVFERAAD
jgi:SAM-dependent methyltransferase